MKTGVIPKFEGEYAFLSNFFEADFTWRNTTFKSGEHAFQAAKAYHIADSYINDMSGYFDSVVSAPTPAKAKYAGRSVRIDVESWDEQKISYMREIVHAKFSGVPGLAGKLINTGACMLVEGNDWGDSFWGRCKVDGRMIGFNTLGTILMEERGYWRYSDFGDKK